MNASIDVLTLFLFNIVLVNIPLLYGTVGEIVTEKAGSLNLGVEGTMAIGAIFGYLAGCMANSLLVGLLVSFLAAGLCGALFALLTVSLQANQNVTGLTITTFGLGLYFFIGKGLGDRWPVMTSADALVSGFSAREIPLLSSIPVVGKALFSTTSWSIWASWWRRRCGGTSPAPRPACACAPWGRTPALPTRWASTSCCISTST